MPTDLKGWHRGEQAIQARLRYSETMAMSYTWIESGMSDQHRLFHTTRLPFVPITTLDAEGRPWGSLAAGAAGTPGFITSPSDSELEMALKLVPGDPLRDNLRLFGTRPRTLTAGIGIEFPTRRRNKFAGWIEEVDWAGEDEARILLKVNQAIGNCPKYINIRDLIPEPLTSPEVVYHKPKLSPTERLPDEVLSFITSADTTFLGTSYEAPKEDEVKFPSHVGMNQRGGRPGFIRVRPSDGRTVVLPDFSGNRLMTSLGNIEVTSLASLTFTSFTTGDVLYLTGNARTFVGPEAQKIMRRQNVLTSVFVTGYIFVRDSLPVRQRPGTTAERSPYSPPVLPLAEEKPSETALDDVTATLQRIELHAPTLATFTFTTSHAVHVRPGQAAILDFSDLLGAREYQHMAPGRETSVNDDRIRTWTVASAHPAAAGTRALALTMREKPDGVVTGALFAIARQLAERRPELLEDAAPLGLSVRLVGVGGDFVLPPAARRLLWVAGGIGVTPFLSMLASISGSGHAEEYDIAFVLSTREPRVLLPLIHRALDTSASQHISMTLNVFTDQPAPDVSFPPGVSVRFHAGRFSRSFLEEERLDAAERDVFLCGSPAFEEAAVAALEGAGVDVGKITREGFGY